MSTKYRYPSELLHEATALADGDWILVQKEGESRLSKITGANFGNISGLAKADGNIIVGDGSAWVAESGATARASLGAQASNANLTAIAGLSYGNDNFIVGNGSTWVAESGSTARTSMGAAPAGGDLSVNWSCDDLRSTSGYFYQQASGGSNRGNINLYDTGVSNGMVFRNATGFVFYGLTGTTRGSVYVGRLETHSILPMTDGTYTIGVTDNRYWRGWFDELYVTAGAVSGSDSRLKTDIADSDLGLDFIVSLRPRRYRLKDRQVVTRDESGAENRRTIPGIRPHYGFVAQEIKEAMGQADFAGYVDIDLAGEQLGLRYEEFIAPLVKAMQELHGQVTEESQARLALEQRLAALEMGLGFIGGK